MLISIEKRKWVLNNDLLYIVLTMTKKTDSIKLNQLHLIKKRRMQKYHARKILRTFKGYEVSDIFIFALHVFITKKHIKLKDPALAETVASVQIKFR